MSRGRWSVLGNMATKHGYVQAGRGPGLNPLLISTGSLYLVRPITIRKSMKTARCFRHVYMCRWPLIWGFILILSGFIPSQNVCVEVELSRRRSACHFVRNTPYFSCNGYKHNQVVKKILEWLKHEVDDDYIVKHERDTFEFEKW